MKTSAQVLGVLSALSIFPGCLGKINVGSLPVDEDSESTFEFLDKFAYDTSGGKLHVQLEPTSPTSNTYISFFADIEEQWPSVVSGELSCEEKLEFSARSYKLIDINRTKLELSVIGSIARWWYIALINCDDPPVSARFYNITFINSERSPWALHFSAHEQGMYEMSIFFIFHHFILLLFVVWSKRVAKVTESNINVLRLLSYTIVVDMVHFFCRLTHYGMFSTDGVGLPRLENFSYTIDFTSQTIFTVLLLLIASGWGISTNRVPKRLIIIFALIMFFGHLIAYSMYLREDKAAETYIYETEAGWALVALRLVYMSYALWRVLKTMKLEREKRRKRFYILMMFLITVYFGTVPFTAFAATRLRPSLRKTIVHGFGWALNALTLWITTAMFQPFWKSPWCPKLGVLETRGGFRGNNQQVMPVLAPGEMTDLTGLIRAIEMDQNKKAMNKNLAKNMAKKSPNKIKKGAPPAPNPEDFADVEEEVDHGEEVLPPKYEDAVGRNEKRAPPPPARIKFAVREKRPPQPAKNLTIGADQGVRSRGLVEKQLKTSPMVMTKAPSFRSPRAAGGGGFGFGEAKPAKPGSLPPLRGLGGGKLPPLGQKK